jgi:hypothetical protein
MPKDMIVMEGVREHGESDHVWLYEWPGDGRPIIRAENEGGFNITLVDLLDVLKWVKAHRPELWEAV